MKMQITIPDEIEHYEPELRLFIDLMIRKLFICRDKGFADNMTVVDMLHLMNDEIEELKCAMQTETQFDLVMECVDVSNQAWLLALVALRISREEFRSQRMGVNAETLNAGYKNQPMTSAGSSNPNAHPGINSPIPNVPKSSPLHPAYGEPKK